MTEPMVWSAVPSDSVRMRPPDSLDLLREINSWPPRSSQYLLERRLLFADDDASGLFCRELLTAMARSRTGDYQNALSLFVYLLRRAPRVSAFHLFLRMELSNVLLRLGE